VEDILSSLVVVLVCAVLVGGIFLVLHNRQKRKEAQLVQEAQSRGWQYQRISEDRLSGYRFSSVASGGIAWTLEATRHSSGASTAAGSSDISSRTRWWSEAATLPNRMVLIGPRTAMGALPNMPGGLGGMIVQAALRMMMGEDADQFPGLSEAQVGSETFRERYMVFAHDLNEAHALLASGVESALIEWPAQQMVIKLGKSGIEISIPQQITDVAEIERIIGLGARLVLAWQSRT
jgi:hypothetical protein